MMFNSFGSSLWMMPFSKHCRAENMYRKHFSHRSRSSHQIYQCDEQEFQQNYSGWPTNIINIEIPSIPGKQLKNHICISSYQYSDHVHSNSYIRRRRGLPFSFRCSTDQLFKWRMWTAHSIILLCS